MEPVSTGILAIPEGSAAVVYGLQEVFSSVGSIWEAATGQQAETRRMTPFIVGPSQRAYRSTFGVPLSPHYGFDTAPTFDVIVVPDIDLHYLDSEHWKAAVGFARNQYEAGATICSVCTGSVLLAETGILDGEEATTHWSAVPVFENRYPAVQLRPERILSPTGPGHRIVTSGGATSWNDLALYLIARYSGEEEARRIAKVFLFGDRSDGQLPFASIARPQQHDDAIVANCQAWIAKHYERRSPVEAMIGRSGLAPRTFARRFRAATGYTPIKYVQTLRVEEAKQMLEATDDAVDDIANSVGYDDPRSFRRLFKRVTGINPRRYRQRFRGAAWS